MNRLPNLSNLFVIYSRWSNMSSDSPSVRTCTILGFGTNLESYRQLKRRSHMSPVPYLQEPVPKFGFCSKKLCKIITNLLITDVMCKCRWEIWSQKKPSFFWEDRKHVKTIQANFTHSFSKSCDPTLKLWDRSKFISY